MATEPQVPAEASVPGADTQSTRASKSSRTRIFFLLIVSFLLMIAVAAVCFGYMIRSWENDLRSQIERDLTQKARMFANDVNSDRTRNISVLTSQEGQLAGARATVIDMNGKLMADSEIRVAELDSEARSPEFTAALRGDTGVDVRSRNTFGVPVMYVAVPVSGGAVRLAYPLADLSISSARASRALVLACCLASAAALVVSAFAAAAISKP